jgi:hypothetical protein
MNSFSEISKYNMYMTSLIVVQTIIDAMKLTGKKSITVEELESMLESIK